MEDKKKAVWKCKSRQKNVSRLISNPSDYKENREFSNLPDDTLRTLISTMDIADQIRFLSLVRESWPPSGRLPWRMYYKRSDSQYISSPNGLTGSQCKRYDPSKRKFYFDEDRIKGSKLRKDYNGAWQCDAKCIWVLFGKIEPYHSPLGHSSIFFYYPSTVQLMKLPMLKMGFSRAAFSSCPTSPDSVVFVLFSSYCQHGDRTVRISTFWLGDQIWNSFRLVKSYSLIEDIIYLNGGFYCPFYEGFLRAFNVASKSWH